MSNITHKDMIVGHRYLLNTSTIGRSYIEAVVLELSKTAVKLELHYHTIRVSWIPNIEFENYNYTVIEDITVNQPQVPQSKGKAARPWESPLSQDELDECARIISAMSDSELATATLREINHYAGTAKEDFENRLQGVELSEVANLVINSAIRLGAHKLLMRKYRELEVVTAIFARSTKWHYAAILPPKRDLVVIMMNETGGQPLLGFHDHDKGWFISAGIEGQYPPSPKPPFAWCGIPDFAGYHEILKG